MNSFYWPIENRMEPNNSKLLFMPKIDGSHTDSVFQIVYYNNDMS